MDYIVIDTEGSMLPNISPWNKNSFLSSIGIIFKSGEYKSFLLNHKDISLSEEDYTKILSEVQTIIDNTDRIVFHNAKHDLNWLTYIGLKLSHKKVWCTLLSEYAIRGQNPNTELNLNAVAARYGLGSKIDKMKEYWDNGYDTDQIPWDLHNEYLEQDCRLTCSIYEQQVVAVKKLGLTKVLDVTFELSKMLSEMELTGFKFDLEGAKKYVEEYNGELIKMDEELRRICNIEFNPSSSDQLEAVLFGGFIKRDVQELVSRPRKNGTFRTYTRKSVYLQPTRGMGFVPNENTKSSKTGKYSTGKNVIQFLHAETDSQKEFVRVLNERRVASKVYSTLWSDKDSSGGLINKVGKDDRIHPSFNQTTTRTARLSSSNPNGQNLPRSGTSPLKKLFYADEGNVIINGDLSQIEWRAAAALSGDKTMIDEIVHGVDIHTDTGVRFFGGDVNDPNFKKDVRQPSKTFNFRMIYNGKANSFHADPNMPNFPLSKWKKIVDGFWEKYNGLRAWQLHNEKMVNNHGYIKQPHGRILTFSFWTEGTHEYKRGYYLNEICNYPVQSICGDAMFLAMIVIYKRCKKLNLKTKFLLQVHDSLVCESPKEEAYTVCDIMLSTFNNLDKYFKEYYGWDFGVPLTGEVSIGKNYGDMPFDFSAKDLSEEKIKQAIDSMV